MMSSLQIEKLDETNYATWCIQMRSILIQTDLWAVTCGQDVKPKSNEAAIAAFENKEQKALSSIILSVKTTQLIHLKSCKTAMEAWKCLKEIHQPKGPARKVMLFKKIIRLRMQEDSRVADYLNEFDNIIESLCEVDIILPDEFLVILLLSSLPKSYENFVVAMETRDSLPSYSVFKVKLLEEGARQVESEKTTNGAETLLHTRHIKKGEIKDGRRSDKNCKQYNNHQRSNRFSVRKCYNCGQPGHFAAKCKVKKGGEQNNCFQVLSTMTGNRATFDNRNFWCIDSGATSHFCFLRELFKNYEDCQEKIILPNNVCVNAIGRGDIEICNGNVTLKNVLHVKDIQNNFISVSKALESGMTVIFKNNYAEIRNNLEEVLIKARNENGLFLFKDVYENKCNNVVQYHDEFVKWHNRFGHVNFQCLKDMISKQIVRGIKLKTMPQSWNCELCAKAKITAKPFPQKSETRSRELLQIIHSDVCGPINKKSFGGARYFVTFIDDYSRYITVYFVKSKDQVLSVFKEYRSVVEKQTGKKIKCLRSDNGGEYVNKAFEQFLRENGIKRQLTVPYTPQHNGVAERANRTLCEMARSMILNAGMSEFFWAEAVRTAAYIRNRITTKILHDKTPYEMWNGRKPAVGYFKIFGSKAIVLDKTVSKKFAAKGVECLLIGYSEVSKGYRLFNPKNQKVIVARDVLFFEEVNNNRIDCNDFLMENAVNQNIAEFVLDQQKEVDSAEDESSYVNRIDERDSINDNSIREGANQPVIRIGPGRPRIIRDGSRGRPRKQYNMLQAIGEHEIQTPENDREALNGPYADDWYKSMKVEYDSLIANNTWELTDLPEGQVAIGCRWVFAVKRNKEGGIQKLKSRLVAKGCSQKFGVNYYETFSPVVRYENIRLVIALAVEHGMYLHQMDVCSAYLNGDLHDVVFMKQPPNFEDKKHPNKVCRLKKSLYGLKQSGREWNSKLDEVLKKLGFKSCISDPCIYTKHVNGEYNIIVVYVDDLIVGSTSLKTLHNTKKAIQTEFECVDGGELSHFLGMEFQRDGKLGAITISQKQYILNALRQFGMENCKEASTPLEPGLQVNCTDNNCKKINATDYQSAIGTLMYLGLSTRPDILLSAVKLAQQNNDPHVEHETYVKHIFRYLKKTASFKLHYQKTGKSIECYVDADWAGDVKDRKSFSGYIFVAAGCVFAWQARKQNLVALSSTEAEYIALSTAATEVVYVRKLLSELWFPQTDVMTMYNDNQSAQCLVKNPTYHSRSKHIAIKYHHVRDMYNNREIEVKYVSTDNMIADILTKNLCKIKHLKFTKCMGLY